MEKNVAGKWIVFAFQDEGGTNPGEPVTGDAANITANVRINGGSASALTAPPTELEDGYYIFDLSESETNGDLLLICPESSTANVNVIGVPGAVWTTPPNFNTLGIETDGDLTQVNALAGHTAQTGDSFARLGAPVGASVSADIAQIDSEVGDILVDTSTTLDNHLTDIKGTGFAKDTHSLTNIEGYVDLIDDGTSGLAKIAADAANILDDTGTTLPATLTTIESKIDTVDTEVGLVLEDTGTTLPGTLTTMDGKLDTIDLEVGDILTDTQDLQTQVGTAGDGLTDLGGMSTAMKAEVNAEVVDTLTTDTYAEPGSVPAATSSLKDKIGWLFTLSRNKLLQTSNTSTVRNDADGADIATAGVSDDGTTFTRNEYS